MSFMMCSFYKCGLFFLTFVVLLFHCVLCYHQCRITPRIINPEANVSFSVIIGLSETDNSGRCQVNKFTEESLQALSAVEWVVGKLNGEGGTQHFLPGIKFGFDIFDDCGIAENAVKSVLEIKDPYFSPLLTTCDSNEQDRIHIGILGPSRSDTAVKSVEHLRGTKIPAVLASATLAALSDKSLYPNVVRTAVSDEHEIDAMVQLLVKLKWTYIAGVHSSDDYGRSGMQLLISKAKERGICINPVIEINGTSVATAESVGRQLISQIQKTTEKELGAIYFGQQSEISNLLFWMVSLTEFKKIHWILSDSFGKMLDESNRQSAAEGAIAITPSHYVLESFSEFYNKKWTDVSNNIVRNQIDEALKSYRDTNSPTPGTLSDHISDFMDAVYVLASAFKDAYDKLCGKDKEICTDLKNLEKTGFLDYVKNVNIDYSNSSQTYFPEDFIQNNRTLSFNTNGEIVKSSSDRFYDVKFFKDKIFNKVGYYTKDTLVINTELLKDKNGASLPGSSCYEVCSACIDELDVPYIVIPGDAYIFGLFSLHEINSDDLFKCGVFRNISTDTITVEAFLHAVDELFTLTGIKFGAIAVDDCYSGLRANYIVTNFFSGNLKFKLPHSDISVDPQKVVAVIGSMSSGVTIPVAESSSRMRMPQVSYAASSPDLDDRISYPYFARTVPSDIYQARAMVEIIKTFKWEYVSIVYVANNYGSEGKKAFVDIAHESGICVAEPIELSETGSGVLTGDLDKVIKTIEDQSAGVVVYFGTDFRLRQLAARLKEKYTSLPPEFIFIGSEDWGTNKVILESGGTAIRGSLTITLDISKSADNNFQRYLVSKTPTNHKINPWFLNFWQAYFKCDPKTTFSNVYYTKCQDDLKLTNDNLSTFLAEQRVIQTMNAVYALGMGIKDAKNKLCNFDSLPCKNFKLFPEKLMESILNVELSENDIPFRVFNADGNGNIGFKIWNVRQDSGSEFSYAEVGTFRNGELGLNANEVYFYDQFGKRTTKTSPCTDKLCKACKILTTPAPQDSTKSPYTGGSSSDSFRWTDVLIILILVLLVVLVIVLVVYCLCCHNKGEDIYSSVHFQNNKYANGQVPASDDQRRIQMLNAESNSTLLDRDINGNRGKVNEGFDAYIHAVPENYDLPKSPDNSMGQSPSREQQQRAPDAVTYTDLSNTYSDETAQKPQYNQSTPKREVTRSLSQIRTDFNAEQPDGNSPQQFPTQMYLPMNQNQGPTVYNPQLQQASMFASNVVPGSRPFSETVLYDQAGHPYVIRPSSFPVQGQIQPVRVVSPVGNNQLNTSIESLPSYSQSLLQFGANTLEAQPLPVQHSHVVEASSDSMNSVASQSPRIRMGVNGSQLASQRQSPQTTQAIPMEQLGNQGADSLNIPPDVNILPGSPEKIINSQPENSSNNSASPSGADKNLQERQLSTSASNSDNNESLPTSPAHSTSRPNRPAHPVKPRKPKPPLRTFSNKSDRDVNTKRSPPFPKELDNSDDSGVSRV